MARRRLFQLFAVDAALISVGVAAASIAGEPPAGLVMEISGDAKPTLSAMTEIPAETRVLLNPGTQLTFLHYERCKLVTVTGGTLVITRHGFTSDGKVDGEKDGPCPRVHQISGTGSVTAGLMMRGGDLPRWPLNPEILLAGNGTDRIEAAAIYAEDQFDRPLLRLEVSGHRLRFPPVGERPAPNGRFVLRLIMAGDSEPLDILFIGAPPTGPNLLIVLREP